MPNPIPKLTPGFRMHDGSDLNKMVDAVNADHLGLEVPWQPTPAALTTSALLTAAQLLTTLLTANQGAAGVAAYQLPTVANMVAGLPPDFINNQCFDFSLVNISAVAAETVSITTNTGWTLVGNMDVQANNAATTKSAGRFRARRVSATAFTLYRLS